MTVARTAVGRRAAVRRVLYVVTLTAVPRNPVLRAFYTRLRARDKPTQVALTAAMRQRLTLRNALKRNQTTWQKTPLISSQA